MNHNGKTTKRRLLSLLTVGALLLPLPLITACSNGDSTDATEAAPHIERAETYTEQGQYRSALLEVRNAIKAEPGNVSHVVRLAELYLAIGAAREASELLAPWLDEYPQDVALPLARAYVRQGKHLSARETLQQYRPESPEQQTNASLIRAEVLRISGDQTEALSLYRNLMANHPSNRDAAVGTIRALLDLNQPGQALRTAENWLQQNAPQPQIHYWKGMAQYRENNLSGAAETLTDAAGELPTADVFLPVRRDILTLLSRVLTEQGKVVEAQVYNKILADNQNTSAQEQGEAAIAALEEGNIEEAKRILGDMLKLDPENRQAALMLGALTTSTGDAEEGSRLLTENLDPETTPTPFLRAATMAQIDTGKREQALQTLKRAMEARPDDNELLAMHGLLALTFEDRQETGVENLKQAISNEPGRTRLRLALAQYYVARNEKAKALEQLRLAFASNPQDWDTTELYMSLLLTENLNTEAEELRDSLLNGYPDAPPAQFLASMADATLGRIDEARQRLEKLVTEQPELQRPRVALGRLLFIETQRAIAAEDWATARDKAAQASELAPKNPNVALLSAAISRAEGKLDQALTDIDAVEEALGDSPRTLLARTSILETRDGHSRAYDYLYKRWQADGSNVLIPPLLRLARLQGPEAQDQITSEWLDKQPDNLSAHMTRADWLMNSGQPDLATRHYEQVLEQEPDNVTALNNLAWILREDDTDQALTFAQRAVENDPENAFVVDTYGWVLHLSGQHAEAVQTLEKALALAPDSQEIASHLNTAKQAL